jgi:hypothetical protein
MIGDRILLLPKPTQCMAHKAMTAWLESPWFKYYAIHSPLTTKEFIKAV